MLRLQNKPWFGVVFALIVFTQCAPNNQEANIKLIERYVDAVENKDTQTMSDLLAEDYVGFGPSVADTTNKTMALAAWEKNVAELYEEIEYERSRNAAVTITDGDYPGDWITNWAILRISYKNGRPPIRIWANSVYQIENGQIKRSFTFYNEADAMRQLGYVFLDMNDFYGQTEE